MVKITKRSIAVRKRRGTTIHRPIFGRPSEADISVIVDDIDMWINGRISLWGKSLENDENAKNRLEIIRNFYSKWALISTYDAFSNRKVVDTIYVLDGILWQALLFVKTVLSVKIQKANLLENIRKAKTRRYKSTSLRSLQKDLSGPVCFYFFDHNSRLDIDSPLTSPEMVRHLSDALQNIDHFFTSIFPSQKLTSYSQDLISTTFKMIFLDEWPGGKSISKVLIEEMLDVFWAVGIDKKRVTYGAYRKKVSLERVARVYPSSTSTHFLEIENMMDDYIFAACDEGTKKLGHAYQKAFGTNIPFRRPTSEEALIDRHIWLVTSKIISCALRLFS